ncbi:MAG: MBOAT family O-acyltransferase [Myxococcota bacterium]|nr:MBOAT family O-acyltransferase [Myxococcota bacterium]
MQFASLDFAAFYLLVFTIYWMVGPQKLVRKCILLGSSLLFYSVLGTLPLLLLILSCVINYGIGKIMNEGPKRHRKNCLLLGIGFNLGFLGLYKYLDFFRESASTLLEFTGFQAHIPIMHVILPIGISFYTFQALTYLIDLYNRHGIAAESLLDFMIFQCFFPQLLIGPICRSVDLLPQITADPLKSIPDVAESARLILSGLFKKTVVATILFEFGVHDAFQNPEGYSAVGLWGAMIGYSIQLYCDFSGYTDMARGFALLMGYRIPENFRHPYAVTNLGEFWKRWHITFSQWLRDYIYIPLGGSHCPAWRVSLNLFLTFLFCGFWHGASWGYVIWGAAHGIAMAAHKKNRDRKRRKGIDPNAPTPVFEAIIGWAYTFLFVALSRVVFQSPSLELAWIYYQRLFSHTAYGTGAEGILVLAIVIGLGMNFFGPRIEKWTSRQMLALPNMLLLSTTMLTLFIILLLRPGGVAPYLYFRF